MMEDWKCHPKYPLETHENVPAQVLLRVQPLHAPSMWMISLTMWLRLFLADQNPENGFNVLGPPKHDI